MKRDTVGKISLALSEKQPETRDPIEIEREVHKDYEKHIHDCIQRHLTALDGNFYVEVITKKERLMPNVLRNYFFATQACPTPTWDQTIYKYHRAQDFIEFLWVVPSKDTVELFLQNALQITDNEKELLQFILKFTDGSLLKLAKKLNGEMEDSPLLNN